MDVAIDLTGYARALGRAEAGWRFAGRDLQRATALATVSAAWDVFRRDAGPGRVGPAHETSAALLLSEDPRRDGVLLWLADHGVPLIAEAAATIGRMVGATRRFSAEDQALLDAACEALTVPTSENVGPITSSVTRACSSQASAVEPLLTIAGAIDRLRDTRGFVETEGVEVRHNLPGGTLRRYVAAAPAGGWALNLALLGRGAQPAGTLSPPGLVSRALFRSDLDSDQIAAQLIAGAGSAWLGVYNRLLRLEPELVRGQVALAHLSRNARTRDAWVLVTALETCKRTHLARALGLSRAGADIQANTLADAGLVVLSAGGKIAWTRRRTIRNAVPAQLDQGPLGDAMSDLDASLAEIDRLLARTTR